MKSILLSAMLAVSAFVPAAGAAPAPVQLQTALNIEPIEIPATLQAQIDAAVAACGCFSSVTAYEVFPHATPAEVFASADVLFGILDLDVQLPWVGVGEIGQSALAARLAPAGQKQLVVQISRFADPAGGGFHLGAYAWSHPTQPDFCSGETLYQMYFPATGVLFAFRFDSSHEC